MKLAIIGTGYVGLITGVCFAEFGYQAVCIDKDQDRINELNNSKCPFYEPGVDTLLYKHLNKTKLLSFSNSLSKSISDADIIFITVGTPSKRIEAEANLSHVWDVAEEISNHVNKYCQLLKTHKYGNIYLPSHNYLFENSNMQNYISVKLNDIAYF